MKNKSFVLLLSAFIILALIAALQPEPEEVNHVNVHRQIAQQEYQKAIEEYETPQLVSLGEFKVTFYCACTKCTDGDRITACGEPVQEGLTIAADTSLYPFGTMLYIEGFGWRKVQDTGPAIQGNEIDIFMESHDACNQAGIKYLTVYKEG